MVQLEVINVQGGSANYMYSIDGENYQSESQFTGLESGNYTMYVSDETDCLTIVDTQIDAPAAVEISLPTIESIINGESVILDPGLSPADVDSFAWTQNGVLINNSDLIIEVSPNITSTYILEIFYEGCHDRSEITIEVKEDKTDIIVGNAFSPNGDNINDILYIQGKLNSSTVINQFTIYDRWGNMIFAVEQPDINDPSQGWDGYSGGSLVATGVYVYLLIYVEDGESITRYGTVTVMY